MCWSWSSSMTSKVISDQTAIHGEHLACSITARVQALPDSFVCMFTQSAACIVICKVRLTACRATHACRLVRSADALAPVRARQGGSMRLRALPSACVSTGHAVLCRVLVGSMKAYAVQTALSCARRLHSSVLCVVVRDSCRATPGALAS